jgi:hypothetical protein
MPLVCRAMLDSFTAIVSPLVARPDRTRLEIPTAM